MASVVTSMDKKRFFDDCINYIQTNSSVLKEHKIESCNFMGDTPGHWGIHVSLFPKSDFLFKPTEPTKHVAYHVSFYEEWRKKSNVFFSAIWVGRNVNKALEFHNKSKIWNKTKGKGKHRTYSASDSSMCDSGYYLDVNASNLYQIELPNNFEDNHAFQNILRLLEDIYADFNNEMNNLFQKNLETQPLNIEPLKPNDNEYVEPSVFKPKSYTSIHPLNQILYGPPGTGKTYHTINKALAIIDNEEERVYKDTDRTELKTRFDALSESGQIGFVTFHQSMSYEDFVEGIKPEINKESKTEQTEPENNDEKNLTKSVGFDIRPGIFKKMAKRAKENPQTPYVLIIDEINRGNVAGIFGELITLIEEDKRIGKREALRVTLPYSQQSFGVPANLHIIGTMNTADRSVEALDTALRRRFVFDEMLPKPELLENQNIEGINLTELLTTINARLEKLLDRDHLIGHAYLWNIKKISHLRHSIYNKIIPQLQEYFYRDYVKIGLVLGTGFVEKKSDKIEFAAFDKKEQDYSDFAEKPTYEIKQIKNDSDFIKAVMSIYKTVES